jgi:hypothetical protein
VGRIDFFLFSVLFLRESCYIVHAGLELKLFLMPLPPKFRDYRRGPIYPICRVGF